MANLTFTADELRELALEALTNGNTETATFLRHNADETEEETEAAEGSGQS